jgi:DNA (cytosine-5)-methyltransferase 1
LLTVGSLMSGIEGLALGLERTGMKLIWQVEINEYAFGVLQKRFPGVKKFRDARNCTGLADPNGGCGDKPETEIPPGRDFLEHVDVVCGGFPCQDISNAGKRKGIEGKRSGLWTEMARLVGEIRPTYVLVENVSALLQRGRGMDKVLGDLATLGYDAVWDCIPAEAVGAPHERDRVFILAYLPCERHGRGSEQPESCESPGSMAHAPVFGPQEQKDGRFLEGERGIQFLAGQPRTDEMAHPDGKRGGEVPRLPLGEREGLSDPDGSRGSGAHEKDLADADYAETGHVFSGTRPDVGDAAEKVSNPLRGGLEETIEQLKRRNLGEGGAWHRDPADDPSVESFVGRVAAGVPHRVDRIRCIGNSVVPQVAELWGIIINRFENDRLC